MSPSSDAVYQVKGLFEEMPSSLLSSIDVAKLSGLDVPTSQVILDALAEAGHLRRCSRGRYVSTRHSPSH